jgi:hypothetical protein
VSIRIRLFFLIIIFVITKISTNRQVAGSIPDGVTGIFSDIILPVALWLWGDSASNRNEYQVYFLGVKAAGA